MKLLLLLLLQTAPEQNTDPIPRLIQEREALVRQYEAANSQRNAFLANKPSKRDLEEVVAALKGIIRKDTEIVQAVKDDALRQTAGLVAERQQVQQQASVAQSDQSTTQERFYDLQRQITNLEERERQHQKKLAEAQTLANEVDQSRTTRDLLTAGLAVLSVGLLVYVGRLRGQRRAPAKRKR
ncbi:hypothetical protein F1C16_07710 [Hymenobacter sp. NBH84]|uniref:hypothetical protein n=1 Tax=Hymenobacter sp. NBH84 TaxID=2596915 RepID=UPI00162927D6|nr:hypothetical protein [Hymenobacter sp. NBH84]QNE39447.1 hypothetical protein F1C16_07710 [Hymenobacter sp. NBH84]